MVGKGFFHPSLGYWQTISDVSDEILSSYPSGTVEVPLKPGYGYNWDGDKWVADQAAIDARCAQEIRNKRDYRLRTEVDLVVSNPLRWADMTAEQQQAWADYRTALLNVPQQDGFPHNVTWPVKPE